MLLIDLTIDILVHLSYDSVWQHFSYLIQDITINFTADKSVIVFPIQIHLHKPISNYTYFVLFNLNNYKTIQ